MGDFVKIVTSEDCPKDKAFLLNEGWVTVDKKTGKVRFDSRKVEVIDLHDPSQSEPKRADEEPQ